MPSARPAHVRDPTSAFARAFRSLLNRVCGGAFLQEMSAILWQMGPGLKLGRRLARFESEGGKVVSTQ